MFSKFLTNKTNPATKLHLNYDGEKNLGFRCKNGSQFVQNSFSVKLHFIS